MLIYNGTKHQFDQDVQSGNIASKIDLLFWENGLRHENEREYISWQNSLAYMQKVLNAPYFNDELQIAIEYQIPQTSKRVDFIVAGEDDAGEPNVIIVELKQWHQAKRTQRSHIVKAYTGGEEQDVPHPSYQAYSYAKTIENFIESVEEKNIHLHPCAYLHNYDAEKLHEIKCDHYNDILSEAPLFIKSDEEELRQFIRKYVSRPPKTNIMYEIDNGRIRPSKALQDSIGEMLNGNEEFIMIDEQKLVFETVLRLVEMAIQNNQKYTIIVEGGPGTGKSVVAIRLLAELIKNGRNAQYVTKNAAPRKVYFERLKQGHYLKGYVKNLFKSSSSYISSTPNTFDCLIVDESHRLNAQSGYYGNTGENQIKEIISASKVNVFFIDESQIVTTNDIGSIYNIKSWANYLGSTVYHDSSTELKSQFRCNGSDGYIAFLDDVLQIRDTANYNGFDGEYEIKIFDDPVKMRDELRLKNKHSNACRMVAGYCYEWVSKGKENTGIPDIRLENGFEAQWNFNSTETWAIDPESFEQIGCIHTCQGLEFEYVGVIIGLDLVFRDGKVITDISQRAKNDFSIRGLNRHVYSELGDRIIRNTYKTLLTRGQKGCFIYCQDSALTEYIKQKILVQKKLL